MTNCSCVHTYRLRTDPQYALGQDYPLSFVNPMGLFSDIGNLEMNDRCKICIERGFDGESYIVSISDSGLFISWI